MKNTPNHINPNKAEYISTETISSFDSYREIEIKKSQVIETVYATYAYFTKQWLCI